MMCDNLGPLVPQPDTLPQTKTVAIVVKVHLCSDQQSRTCVKLNVI